MNKPKIIVILGQTASGKSSLAVDMAKKFGGEVVSADSRQVYKSLDIGTGKIMRPQMKGVSHHLLDVVTPRKRFTVENYKRKADRVIEEIIERGRLPILCGGTGFYIQAVVDGIEAPPVKPDESLRKRLSTKSALGLFSILKKLDPRRAEEIGQSNKVRLIRAIEIARTLGKVPEIRSKPKYDVLQIGIKTDDEELKKKIKKRLLARLKQGMIEEAERLHKKGLPWKRMRELGLEYSYLALLLTGKISREDFIERLNSAIWHYARRQKTWFKRDNRIKWFSIKEKDGIEREINKFLK